MVVEYPEPRGAEPSEQVVQAIELGRLIARARRAAARAQRLPGLGLLLSGTGRGRVDAIAAHVPALSWSAGISGLWIRDMEGSPALGGWREPERAASRTQNPAPDRAPYAERGDQRDGRHESRTPPVELPLLVSRAAVGHAGRGDQRDGRHESRTLPVELPLLVSRAAVGHAGRGDQRNGLRERSGEEPSVGALGGRPERSALPEPRTSRDGLETIAPALALLRPRRVNLHQDVGVRPIGSPLGALRATPPAFRAFVPLQAQEAIHDGAAASVATRYPVLVTGPTPQAPAEPTGPARPAAEIGFPSRAPGLGAPEIIGSIRAFVAEEVKQQIDRTVLERPAPLVSPAGDRAAQPAHEGREADERARDMRKRMRALAQEDRFRSGKIR